MEKGLENVLATINPMVCYNSKVKMLNRMMGTLYDSAFKPHGLTGNQFTMLLFIAKTRSSNQKMIADMLVINFSTVSRDLSKLAEAGWVNIEKGTDARNTRISLSVKGADLLAEVIPVWKDLNDDMEVLFGAETSKMLEAMISTIKKRE